MDEWIKTSDQLPPLGLVVETKIDDEKGVRNVGPCKRKKTAVDERWFTSGGEMYLHYTPTHWRYIAQKGPTCEHVIGLLSIEYEGQHPVREAEYDNCEFINMTFFDFCPICGENLIPPTAPEGTRERGFLDVPYKMGPRAEI